MPPAGRMLQRAAKQRTAQSPATIYDIAALAGVNASTVSRALTKPGRVSAKTQKKIEDAAAQLNYQANPFARALPTGKTNTVGLIVSDITNPAYFDVIRGAEGAASARDYTLLLAESAESAQTELLAAKRIMTTVDGIILASPRLADEQIRELAKKKPVVVINRMVEEVGCVVADVQPGVTEAVRHLATLGHESLAYVAGPDRSWMSGHRWDSIRGRCEWSGLRVRKFGPGTPTVDGGREMAAAIRESGATGIICYNDLMAIGLMQELQSAGVRIPAEFSIVGFDNIFGSDFTTPPLSTVKSPLRETGATALTLILAELAASIEPGRADDSALRAEAAKLATELVIRGSSGQHSPAAL
ncbi:LacI family DNA-binding transcriptional regulator [Arthrobacter terrae]|nr:LacI family DNA-binding transcriptional regulator [Arthrobacter terrae]